jgi:mannonate dehydratase
VEVNYDGNVMMEHAPSIVGGNYAEGAYGFAYMMALFHAAQFEAQAQARV